MNHQGSIEDARRCQVPVHVQCGSFFEAWHSQSQCNALQRSHPSSELPLYCRFCLFDAVLCEAVGRLIGGNVFMPGNLINAENCVVNVVDFAEGILSIPSQ